MRWITALISKSIKAFKEFQWGLELCNELPEPPEIPDMITQPQKSYETLLQEVNDQFDKVSKKWDDKKASAELQASFKRHLRKYKELLPLLKCSDDIRECEDMIKHYGGEITDP